MESNRLYIEAMEYDDRYELYEYYKQEACFKYLTISKVNKIDDMDELYDLLYRDSKAYVLILKTSGLIIGDISFYKEDNKLYLYYILDPKWWNQGYMFEALSCLLDDELYAKVNIENASSIALLKKLGFILTKKAKICEFRYRKEG